MVCHPLLYALEIEGRPRERREWPAGAVVGEGIGGQYFLVEELDDARVPEVIVDRVKRH